MKTIEQLGLNPENILFNLPVSELIKLSLESGDCQQTNTKALVVDTGEFKGRSPKDKYVVMDDYTKDKIWFGEVNNPLSEDNYNKIYSKLMTYCQDKKLYLRDCHVCSDPKYRLNVRVLTETAWASLFANNMFIRPENLNGFEPDWNLICVPSFKSDSETDGTRQSNATIINFSKKEILIFGSGYTGEIKKSVFTILNAILPLEHNVLSLHCAANIGARGDTALFLGLSGSGKTSCSADQTRRLCGDDEHGWSEDSIFNFEGGCYAKCVNLSSEKEPQIFNAIREGSLLENVVFYPNSNVVDYKDISKTENTRVSYPLNFIKGSIDKKVSPPKNIFFLSYDAFGVLPAISKLTPEQAEYHYLSGFTSKLAGTEIGIINPEPTFSACFGRAFLPLHPSIYVKMFGEKIKNGDVNVWLVNTGYIGGGYGVGSRIELKHTRNLIKAAINGDIRAFETLPIFNLKYPIQCNKVPFELLDPRNLWDDKEEYDIQLNKLYKSFEENIKKYRI